MQYKNGSRRFYRLSPFRKLVPRRTSSSKMPSSSYPADEIIITRGCYLAPVPETMTSHCLRPRWPGQLLPSSHTTRCGL